MSQTLDATLGDLLASDDDSLFEQLGMTVKANAAGQAAVAGYAPHLVHDETMMGPLDDLRTLGKRVLSRWNRELHHVMCGSDTGDQKDRESLFKALGVSDVAVAAAMTTLLASWGVAAAIATVVAALIVKRFVSPFGEEVCKLWGEKLGAT